MKFIEFDIPNKQLNGAQLKAELAVDEVYVRDDKLVIGGDITEAEAQAGIAAHIAIDTYAIHLAARAAATAKLEALGLTADDLKALGL